MEALLQSFALHAALGCEAAGALVLALGALQALVGVARSAPRWDDLGLRKRIWVRFAVWIVLALEFCLAGDILRTAVSPSWSELGQLAAIAAIRTALNWFLERDIELAAAGGSDRTLDVRSR